jgi:hypothetical protein
VLAPQAELVLDVVNVGAAGLDTVPDAVAEHPEEVTVTVYVPAAILEMVAVVPALLHPSKYMKCHQ